MKASKAYDIIYISAMVTPTQEDGDVLTLLALDDYSKFLFPPTVRPVGGSDQEFLDTLVKFFNGINEKYDRTIHAQSTTYYTDLPQAFHPFISAVIMKEDKLVYEPEKVKHAFKPVLEHYGDFVKRKD